MVGSTIRLNSHPFTVVGVAEQKFLGMGRGFVPEVWVPMRMADTIHAQSIMKFRLSDPGC